MTSMLKERSYILGGLRIGIVAMVTLFEQISLYHSFVDMCQKVLECAYRACGTTSFVSVNAGIKIEEFSIVEYLYCEARYVVDTG